MPTIDGVIIGRDVRIGCDGLYLCLLRHFERVVNVDTQVPYSAFGLASSEEEPNDAQIIRSPVNQGRFGRTQCVGSIGGGILTHGDMRRAAKATWEQEIVASKGCFPDLRVGRFRGL